MADLANRHFMQMFANGGKFRKLDLGPKANQGYKRSIIERFYNSTSLEVCMYQKLCIKFCSNSIFGIKGLCSMTSTLRGVELKSDHSQGGFVDLVKDLVPNAGKGRGPTTRKYGGRRVLTMYRVAHLLRERNTRGGQLEKFQKPFLCNLLVESKLLYLI